MSTFLQRTLGVTCYLLLGYPPLSDLALCNYCRKAGQMGFKSSSAGKRVFCCLEDATLEDICNKLLRPALISSMLNREWCI